MNNPLIFGSAACVLLASCGAMDAVKDRTAKATQGISQFSLTDLRPAKVDVVEVREADLKEMPLGKDRALAFDQERKRSFWSAFTPKKNLNIPMIPEPTLPVIEEGEMDGFLLPPREL